MVKLYPRSFSFIAFFFAIPVFTLAAATAQKNYPAHSLGSEYKFDPRDGWQAMEATDLSYKYRSNATSANHRSPDKRAVTSLGDSITGVISHVWDGMKAIGKSNPVTITWTSHLPVPQPFTAGMIAQSVLTSLSCAMVLRNAYSFESWTAVRDARQVPITSTSPAPLLLHSLNGTKES
ncbi:hypothetical protein DXG01_010575 [Tephrocybe rancida]|nr:hypothetical protein DXG01_010575 [Tephrocybe rancida]